MTYSSDLIGYDRVAGIVDEWRSLNDSSAVGNVFLGPDWYLSWAESIGAGRNHSIVTVRDESKLVAVVPFVFDRVGTLGSRRLSMASALDTAPDFLDFLTADHDVAGVMGATVDVLRREYSARTYIDLPSLTMGSRVLRAACSLAQLGRATFDEGGECPAMELSPDFDALLSDFRGRRNQHKVRCCGLRCPVESDKPTIPGPAMMNWNVQYQFAGEYHSSVNRF